MEKRILEFENYIDDLRPVLVVQQNIKEEICCEIRQSLYDKFEELLVKGYGIEESVSKTLDDFEDAGELAGSFNEVHNKNMKLLRALNLLHSKKIPLVAVLAVLLLLFII
jgi:hypothetical protein